MPGIQNTPCTRRNPGTQEREALSGRSRLAAAVLASGLLLASCSHLGPYVQGPPPRPAMGNPPVVQVASASRIGESSDLRPVSSGETWKEVDVEGTIASWSSFSEPGSGFQCWVSTDEGPFFLKVTLYQEVPWTLSVGAPVRLRTRIGEDGTALRLDDAQGMLLFLVEGTTTFDPSPLDPPLQVRPRSSQAWIEALEDEARCRSIRSHRTAEVFVPGGQILVLSPGIPKDVPEGPTPFRVLLTMHWTVLEDSCRDARPSRMGWWWMRIPSGARTPWLRKVKTD